jgi:hypothetical protein
LPRPLTPSRLLAPVPLAKFFAQSWGEHALRVPGARNKYTGLFGWQDLNHLLATQRLEPPRLRLAKHGAGAATLESFLQYRVNNSGKRQPHLDVRALNRQLAGGATLNLNAVHEMHPSLAALAKAFARLFLVEPQINLYASFGRQPGFGPHWDDHDVFVLQLAGQKRWLLYGESRRYPLYRDARPNEMQPLKPLARYRLRAGDLLYIPRGHWHDAIAVGEPTLHLTLGVATLTGVDFLRWLADDARSVESARRNIPLFNSKRSAHGLRPQWLKTIGRATAARLDATTVARYLDHCRATLDPVKRPALPHGANSDTLPASSDFLQWTGTSHATLATRSEGLVVRTMEREFVFDPAAAPLIERLLTGKPLRYGALLRAYSRKLGPRRLPRFVGELLREHFLTIVPRL